MNINQLIESDPNISADFKSVMRKASDRGAEFAGGITTEIDRRLSEHVELVSMVARLGSLLQSIQRLADTGTVVNSAIDDAAALLLKVRV